MTRLTMPKTTLPAIMVLVFGATALGGLFYLYGLMDTWQEKVLDRFFLKRGPPGEILIIGIDDASIAKVGQWPWPRAVFGDLVYKIQEARAIGIDVNFSEPSRLGSRDDQVFVDALKASGAKIVLPMELNLKTGLVVRPLPELASLSKQGLVNIVLASDGVARFVQNIPGRQTFGSILAEAFAEKRLFSPQKLRIDYLGPEKTFPTLSAIDVLEDRAPSRIFQDKIILVGATARDLHDSLLTPFGSIPAVEAHASIVASLLRQSFFREAPRWSLLLAILLVNVLTALVIGNTARLPILLPALVVIFLAIQGISLLSFESKIVFFNLYPSFGFVLTAGSLIAFKYSVESREKRFLRKTFQYYLATEVINELVKDPGRVTLGGERKKITILFSDIRGFTSLSERLNPEELTHLLNEYLSAMTDIILAHRGLVDKYIGDAIMAFWGAPLTQPLQAVSACQAALEMIRRLGELNRHWEERGLPTFDIGVGINTGEVFVGNIGSKERFSYTIIGDEVNFASRLEGLNKIYGTNIIIGESTKRETEDQDHFLSRELDYVLVKGKKEPRRIFELVTQPMNEKFKQITELFAAGKMWYAQGAWEKAIAQFQAALNIGDDGPSKIFLARAQELKQSPPAEWSGIYKFISK